MFYLGLNYQIFYWVRRENVYHFRGFWGSCIHSKFGRVVLRNNFLTELISFSAFLVNPFVHQVRLLDGKYAGTKTLALRMTLINRVKGLRDRLRLGYIRVS